MTRLLLPALLALLTLLAGCASGPRFTVDDGRPVNEPLLGGMRAYGAGERLIRPAIARSAALQDRDCDKQWELPFAVATSAGWGENDRVAWVRALQVDERLTVIAITQDSPLPMGTRINRIGGQAGDDGEHLLEWLADARDAGRPFHVGTATGKDVLVTPFEVCRGYTRFAPPNTPQLQDYHWLLSLHPLELTQAEPTPDEALWMVLWTQGLSEEGGARMKTYHYAIKIAGTLYNLATLASGVKAAAMAADAAISAAKSAAANVASDIIRQQLIEQGKALAAQRVRDGLVEAAQQVSRQQVLNVMQAAAANRGSLGGISRIAATAFERADAWAFTRMAALGAPPLAGFTLHQKLIERSFYANAFLFDADRLAALNKVAAARGFEAEVTAILGGFRADALLAEIGAMPLASARASFSFESADDPGAGRFSRGLVDAMLELPIESAPKQK
ncbi:hypothetical protein [Roseateles saccharophilus]|uniref:Lipoprotein n=1 Tax=Roseateles saccharophilus TaxID=304 RepID=A0A4R3VKW9_ROSSA|nr:hypothetical protein [Roseateles saccharophilus]MDG0831383.1 hypothetical protein [Roseateles saccharophilus]TCV04514.1 hypothetical protein EV671_1001270 [Roseateles saccharophilus]